MIRKGRVIAGLVLIVAAIAIVATIAIVAGILFLRSSGDTVPMAGATAVGVPTGPATTKSIGPAGGSIASPDRRITVNVPPNAVTNPVDFSVQPITNLARGGLGSAYRLEPSGQKFAAPIKVSFKYDAQDLEGTIPETLAVAYQDPTGVWQSLRTINIDQASKTLTVSTTHFTDWSVWTIRLSPEKATLRVRETQSIELIGCIETLNLLARIRTFLGRPDCIFLSPEEPSWSVDYGTLTRVSSGSVVYQAPAKRPSPNVATVSLKYRLRDSSEDPAIKTTKTCKITIIDRGYKARGEIGGGTIISGSICPGLETPFTLMTNNKFMTSWEFTPTSKSGGTWRYLYQSGVAGEGGGQYWLEGPEAERTAIVLNGSGTGTNPLGQTATGGGVMRIDLVPLELNECGGG